ncbi:GNAT family N-acetyltransferase (plasmid) [Streptomyces sp. BI20]|uniref:GNAT family N-acetyltransferase n=1 Tax=Streptomyces sp. BI20 TaxID=3403460 RepID=UPI003C76E34B
MDLRRWAVEDARALVAAFRDPRIRASTALALDDADAAREWTRTVARQWEQGVRYAFAVLAEGEVVGHVVLKGPRPHEAEAEDEAAEDEGRGEGDARDGAGPGADGGFGAEVGYWTVGAARGRGIAPRAVRAVTEWAFGLWAPSGLDRIDLLHQVDNPASCRVAGKTGFAHVDMLPPAPPEFPLAGHVHRLSRPGATGTPPAP